MGGMLLGAIAGAAVTGDAYMLILGGFAGLLIGLVMGTVKFGESTTRASRTQARSRRAPIIVMVFCFAIYGLSFVMPLDLNDYSTILGFHCFLVAFQAGLGLLFPGSGHAIGGLLFMGAWAANPVFWVGTWLLLHEQERLASISGFLALLPGLLVLVDTGGPKVWGTAHFPLHGIYSCYYVWLASFASLAIGGFLTGLRSRVRPG
jgi:hypothetical protein